MNKLAPIENISQSIVRVLGLNPGPFTLQGTNTYVIGRGERRILVDTGDGSHPEYYDLLKQSLGASRIDRILLTHWHADHIGGVNQLLSMPDVVVSDCTVYKNYNTAIDQREDVMAMLSAARAQDCLRDIADGQEFEVDGGNILLKAMFTPGHTNDHVSITVKGESIETENEPQMASGTGSIGPLLITGDLVLGQGTTIVDDLQLYMDSLDRVLGLDPSALLPGHGPTIRGCSADGKSNAVRVIQGYIEHRKSRERQILDVLSRPSHTNGWRVEDITSVVYSDISDPRVIKAAQHNTLLHLKKLLAEGKVRRFEDNGSDHVELWELIKGKI
ncbi:Beta-lactamase-like protein 2 [Coemansia sp. RSA 1813]|nr:Beta-lactamase-like protein 2 [Coemansia sp. RSA 1646]KAJ1771958.1 Beta-lactamase-like protein 2 [Coemansia sp. RSA 1843]KAJ2089730.1 Beta-lactamase-like protein 2 [Coemansia sp. RSA 986]KAJ2214265.1 Beta-lactamase-like protein 2 [Coemansia sp. RSA 487]KAJ2569683.1 Beta-lactamase-like protein 2 [Coemansia sp. RSA 1813]